MQYFVAWNVGERQMQLLANTNTPILYFYRQFQNAINYNQ